MKIGLLITEKISNFNYNVLKSIINNKNYHINGVYIDRRKTLSRYQKLKKNIKRGRGFFTIIMFVNNIFRSNEKSINVHTIFNKEIIYDIYDLYNKNSVDLINDNRHDVLLLISGYGIIREPILSITPRGILSYHHGNIRKYRGMPPLFWEYYHRESECGATVQRLSKKLDAGEIMAETSIIIDYKRGFQYNKRDLYRKSESLMTEALRKIESGEKGETPKQLGKVYTLPNLHCWLKFSIINIKRKIINN